MYIKLYEQWLNEAQGVKLDQILLNGLSKTKLSANEVLSRLSEYGKIFESQIRRNLDTLRNTYATQSIWNNLNTKEGIDMAINNFRDLFFMSYGGSSRYASPLTAFQVKVDNALEFADGDFFYNITIDNELWRSNEAVELKNIIVNGNEKMAKGIAASIILFDLAVAVTNGLYFMSGSVTLSSWKGEKNVNLRGLLDTTLTGELSRFENVVNIGEKSKDFTSLKDVYTRPYNNSIEGEWKRYDVEYNFDQFIPFVKQMTFDNIIKSTRGGGNWVSDEPAEFFAPLFVGHYMSNNAIFSMAKAVEFMKAGGPSLLQSTISKISKGMI